MAAVWGLSLPSRKSVVTWISQQTTINTFFIWYKIIIFRIFVSEAMNGLVATFYNHSIINIVNLMLYHKA